VAVARAVRRVRRRRILWAATGLLALAAGLIAVWPAQDRFRASAVVDIGAVNGQGLPAAILELNASDVGHPDATQRVIKTVQDSEVLRVQISTTASDRGTANQRVRDAAELVRVTAAQVAPSRPGPLARAQADLDAAEAGLKIARTRLTKAERALTDWKAAKGGLDPATELEAAKQVYNNAIAGGDPNRIKDAQDYLFNANTANTRYSELVADRDAATAGVKRAAEIRDRAFFSFKYTPSAAAGAINVSPIREETLKQNKPASRLSLGAIMLVFAIAAADALFLTRVKFAVPDDDAPAVPVRVPTPVPPPAPAQVPVMTEPLKRAPASRRRQPRLRRQRIAASPLALPNIEVHLLDREGGLRAVQLRDAGPQSEATNAQQPQER
jgi:hypothetical protein